MFSLKCWSKLRSSRFYTLAGVPLWVVHSKDLGQLISCHSFTNILGFCEIIFWFLTDSFCPALGPDRFFAPKTKSKHAKMSTIAPKTIENVKQYPEAQLVFLSILFPTFLPQSDRADLSVIYSEMMVSKEFIVFTK